MADDEKARSPSPTGYLEPSTSPRRRSHPSKSITLSISSSSSLSDPDPDDEHGDDDDDDDDSSSDTDSLDSEMEHQLAFEESVRQLQLIVNVVALPYVCKWFGRKVAFWSWERYVNMGRTLGWSFWGLQTTAWAR